MKQKQLSSKRQNDCDICQSMTTTTMNFVYGMWPPRLKFHQKIAKLKQISWKITKQPHNSSKDHGKTANFIFWQPRKFTSLTKIDISIKMILIFPLENFLKRSKPVILYMDIPRVQECHYLFEQSISISLPYSGHNMKGTCQCIKKDCFCMQFVLVQPTKQFK